MMASGCVSWDYKPQIKQATSTTLIEYVIAEFGDCDIKYEPGTDYVYFKDNDWDCCGYSRSFKEEEVRRLYNFLGCWLDARE